MSTGNFFITKVLPQRSRGESATTATPACDDSQEGAFVIIRDAIDADVPTIAEIVNAFLRTTTAEWREAEYTVDDRRAWLERDFRQPGWQHGLGPFDAIVTNQSVHELRHKRDAAPLYAATKTLLGTEHPVWCPTIASVLVLATNGST